MVKVYLSRHGHTNQNEERKKGVYYNHDRAKNDVTYTHLTEEGISQAKILGAYLKHTLKDPKKILFVSSTKQRTKNTVEHAAEALGVKLDASNHYVSPHLHEDITLEDAQRYFKNETDPQLIKWRDSRLPKEELRRKVSEEIMNITKNNSGREIVMVLHDKLNMDYLKSIGAPLPANGFDNCAVYELDITDGEIKPIEYTGQKKMKKKLEQLL